VRFTDPEREEVSEESFDLIVLSVGMTLRKGTKSLMELFRLNLTEEGFVSSPPSQTGVLSLALAVVQRTSTVLSSMQNRRPFSSSSI
jgi:heterodisulfide reductase subunit A-like polyferredoxin